MHTTHVSSGGRYPVLRTLAILYLLGAVAVLVIGIWRAVNVITATDPGASDIFGATPSLASRLLVAVSWLAASFIGILAMFGMAELIKLFIDIEHNTRVAGMRAMSDRVGVTTGAPVGSTGGTMTESTTVVVADGDGVPAGGRVGQFLEGEETAEGALIRGH
jgi:hypothetical protein